MSASTNAMLKLAGGPESSSSICARPAGQRIWEDPKSWQLRIASSVSLTLNI
jgi:hypothetical protein